MSQLNRLFLPPETACAEPGCIRCTAVPDNAWAYGPTLNTRFCPPHSNGAMDVADPHALSASETFALTANKADVDQFIGLTLLGNMQIREVPGGFIIAMEGPIPPVLKALKHTSRLLGVNGQRPVEQMPLGLPPAIRIVVPWDMLTDEARNQLISARANPRRIKL